MSSIYICKNFKDFNKDYLNYIISCIRKKGELYIVNCSQDYYNYFKEKISFPVFNTTTNKMPFLVIDFNSIDVQVDLYHAKNLKNNSFQLKEISFNLKNDFLIQKFKCIKQKQISFKQGVNFISGKNRVGKTTCLLYIKDLLKIPSNYWNYFYSLTDCLSLQTNSVFLDFLMVFYNLNYSELFENVKKDILKIEKELSFLNGKNSMMTEKEIKDFGHEDFLKKFINFEKKSLENFNLTKKNLQKKIENKKIGNQGIQGIEFNEDFDINSVPKKYFDLIKEIQSLQDSISKDYFDTVKNEIEKVDNFKPFDHSIYIHENKNFSSTEEKKQVIEKIKECSDKLKILKEYKKKLISRIYQKKILNLQIDKMKKFIQENLLELMNVDLNIDLKKMQFSFDEYNTLSNYERVVLEVLIRCYLNLSNKSDFICIDEKLDCLHHKDDFEKVKKILEKYFKYVIIISHKWKANENENEIILL